MKWIRMLAFIAGAAGVLYVAGTSFGMDGIILVTGILLILLAGDDG